MFEVRALLITAVWFGGFTLSAEAQAQCEWESGFRISTDSIGPFAVTDPIGVVRELCPQARDTVYGGSSPLWPAIVFSVPWGEVLGFQTFRKVLDEAEPATLWHVTGDGLLPEGLSMKSPWGDLRRAYGSASGYGEWAGELSYVLVEFDRYPGLSFDLETENVDWSELRWLPEGDALDVSSVPDSARISKIIVDPPGCPTWARCSRETGR